MSLHPNDLFLFARVIEAGSFSRAAERVGLPKSTLSRRITKLETELGERLLMRSTRRLAITEFGERILDHARRVIEETEAASGLALHRQGTPRGQLRVSMPPDFAELDLASFCLRFAASYPEVSLEMDLSPRRVDLLAERFDVAIRAATRLPDDATLVARKLWEWSGRLYASPAYLARHGAPQKPEDLLDHVCLRIIASNGQAMPWQLSRGTERWEGTPSGPLAANSIALQRELAVHGMGIFASNDPTVRKWLAQDLLQPVLPDWSLPSVSLWCVTPGRRLMPARTRVFIEMMKETLERAGVAPP